MCNNTPQSTPGCEDNNGSVLKEKLKAKEQEASWAQRPVSGSSMLSQARMYSGVFTLGQDKASLTFAADGESHGAFLQQF